MTKCNTGKLNILNSLQAPNENLWNKNDRLVVDSRLSFACSKFQISHSETRVGEIELIMTYFEFIMNC